MFPCVVLAASGPSPSCQNQALSFFRPRELCGLLLFPMLSAFQIPEPTVAAIVSLREPKANFFTIFGAQAQMALFWYCCYYYWLVGFSDLLRQSLSV